jgi:hypothetical protein
MENSLGVLVTVDKNIITVGDRIQIVAMLKNTSSRSYFLYTRPAVYPTGHVKLQTRDGRTLKDYVKIMQEVRRDLLEDFAEMRPGSEVRMAFTATVRRETIPDFEKGGGAVLWGLFLDFENSAILLSGKGEYTLKFHFEQSRELSEMQEEEFAIRRVWHGSLESSPLSIVVR